MNTKAARVTRQGSYPSYDVTRYVNQLTRAHVQCALAWGRSMFEAISTHRVKCAGFETEEKGEESSDLVMVFLRVSLPSHLQGTGGMSSHQTRIISPVNLTYLFINFLAGTCTRFHQVLLAGYALAFVFSVL